MLVNHVAQRLQRAAVFPEMDAALRLMSAQDEPAATEQPSRHTIIPVLYELLTGEQATAIQPFAMAWAVLFGATKRLDHLQDGDLPDHPLPTRSTPNAQYNLMFAYYVLAHALLDDLGAQGIPCDRILKLHHFWSDCVLRVASGQQRDLEGTGWTSERGLAALDQYQHIAHAKAGALFALAFGGAALLATDAPGTITIFTFVGELFGTLLQYKDDVLDAPSQPAAGLTLPHAYHVARTAQAAQLPHDTVAAYWHHVYQTYLSQVDQALAGLPPDIQQGILRLFATTFRSEPDARAT